MLNDRRILEEALFGDDDAELKARVPQIVRDDAGRKARALGFKSVNEWAKAVFLVALYGRDAVTKCHAERFESAAQNWASSGFDSGMGPLHQERKP